MEPQKLKMSKEYRETENPSKEQRSSADSGMKLVSFSERRHQGTMSLECGVKWQAPLELAKTGERLELFHENLEVPTRRLSSPLTPASSVYPLSNDLHLL